MVGSPDLQGGGPQGSHVPPNKTSRSPAVETPHRGNPTAFQSKMTSALAASFRRGPLIARPRAFKDGRVLHDELVEMAIVDE
jgi:hypothetical protein